MLLFFISGTVTAQHDIPLKVIPRDLSAEKLEKFKQHFREDILTFMDNNELSPTGGIGEFLKYIEDTYKLLTKALGYGCLEIRVQCHNLESLERLWKDCNHGFLNRMAERYLVTNELKKKLDLKALRLSIKINEKDYLACKESFLEVVKPLKEESVSGIYLNCLSYLCKGIESSITFKIFNFQSFLIVVCIYCRSRLLI